MGVLGIVPFNQVTANQTVFLNVNTATGVSTSQNVVGFKQGGGMLNALIVNGTASFAIYDANINNSAVTSMSTSAGFTSYSQFSASVVTSGTNLLVSFGGIQSSASITGFVPLPTIIDVNIPFKNGLVIVGSNAVANVLVA